MPTRTARSIIRLSHDVTFVEGPISNWTIVAQADGLALIDAGYPADAELVIETLRESDHSPADLRRIYITHGHVDHIGGIPAILERFPHTEVLCHPDELANVHGPEREQVTPRDLGARLVLPRTLSWLSRIVRADALAPLEIPAARAYDTDFAMADENAIIRPIPAPGHTASSVAYFLSAADALCTGDAIVTDHDLLPRRWTARPQLIPTFFTADRDSARSSACGLRLPSIVLPGHGPAMVKYGRAWVLL